MPMIIQIMKMTNKKVFNISIFKKRERYEGDDEDDSETFK